MEALKAEKAKSDDTQSLKVSAELKIGKSLVAPAGSKGVKCKRLL